MEKKLRYKLSLLVKYFIINLIFVFISIQLCYANEYSRKQLISCDIKYGEAYNDQGQLESLLMDIYQPNKTIKSNRPAIIMVHGGGFVAGDKQQVLYVKMAKTFAEHGYVSFSINYRLKLDRDSAFGDAYKALMWIKKFSNEYGIDPKKVFIMGDSAGGAIAVNTAFANPSKTEFLGCIDLWGGLAQENPAYMHKPSWDQTIYAQPLSPNVPPTCIIHGTIDPVVPIQTSKVLSEELTSVGVYNELHILEGAKHYPETYAEQFIPIMLKFVDKVISGQTIPHK